MLKKGKFYIKLIIKTEKAQNIMMTANQNLRENMKMVKEPEKEKNIMMVN